MKLLAVVMGMVVLVVAVTSDVSCDSGSLGGGGGNQLSDSGENDGSGSGDIDDGGGL